MVRRVAEPFACLTNRLHDIGIETGPGPSMPMSMSERGPASPLDV